MITNKNILNNNNNINKNKNLKSFFSRFYNNNYQTKIEKSRKYKLSELIIKDILKYIENKYLEYLVEQRERIISKKWGEKLFKI